MRVSDVMTRSVRVVSPRQTIQEAARLMGEIDAGALPVGDDNRLVGILSLGDIAVVAGRRAAGEALAGISQPGGAHSQTIGLS